MPVLQLRFIEPVLLQTHLASSGPDSSSTCMMVLELKGTIFRPLSAHQPVYLAMADGMGAVPAPDALDTGWWPRSSLTVSLIAALV